MFLQHYGLLEQPFGVTPDPRFLYPGAAHREALASLIYSFESELGFSSLIADPGLGKTTLLYSLLERFGPSTRNAYIFETQCDSKGFLRHILSDLDWAVPDIEINAMFRGFRDLVLHEAISGRRVLIIIDEAQNLGEPVLETVRLLSNFETSGAKLVHIVLAGQPQLAQILARREMAQLRQRITIPARLRPFSASEVAEYIGHRLRVAGHDGRSLFTPEALALIAEQSGGIPREINRTCFNAMSLGFALERPVIGADIVQEAGADLDLGALLVATHAPLPAAPAPLRPQSVPPRAAAEASPAQPGTQPAAPPAIAQEIPCSSPAAMSAPRTSPLAAPSVVRTTGPAALRPEPARCVAEPARLKPQPVLLRPAAPATAPAQQRAAGSERIQVPIPAAGWRKISKYAVLAPAVFLALTIVLGFRGPLHSTLSSRLAPGPTPSLPDTTTNPATATAAGTSPGTAPVVEVDNSTARDRGAAPSASSVTQTSPTLSRAGEATQASGRERGSAGSRPEQTGAPAPMELAAPAQLPNPAAEDTSAAAPPKMAMTPETAATIPMLPLVRSTDVALPTPTSNIRIGASAEHLSPGRLLTRVVPRYPAAAREAHIQGSVMLSVHIGRDGRVSGVEVLRGNSILASAAADAVRQWVYTPFTLNGQAIEADTNIVVNFAL